MKKTTTLTAILCSCCLVFAWTFQATAANLQLGVSQAPASGVSAAVIGIVGADDVESFTLTLNFANGTLLNLAGGPRIAIPLLAAGLPVFQDRDLLRSAGRRQREMVFTFPVFL